MNKIYIYFMLLLTLPLQSQQIAKNEYGSFLLKNATLVTVTNGTQQADLLIKDGVISKIGQNLSASDAKQIDCTDHFVYPGFIDSGTRLGLSEIGAISLTQDYNELGDFNAHMDALTAVNPNSVSIPVTRVNGVTTVLSAPGGGKFPGQAALINLIGYTPEQMYAGFKAVVMNFPSSGKRGRWDRRSEEDIKKDEEKATKSINEYWAKAKLYAKIDSAAKAQNKDLTNYDASFDAMIDAVNGDAKMLIEVNKDKDILAALRWIKKQKVDAILTGVAEGWRVLDSLKASNVPVITGPILRLPSRQSDRYDAAYTNAAKMVKAGIKVAIRTREIENVRNLPYNAGFAATYGLGIEEALKAITIVPAEIFGLADKYGSLEEGKRANLFISNGDPFETKTDVKHLFIEGWKVPIESRHTLLYDEFLERSPGMK